MLFLGIALASRLGRNSLSLIRRVRHQPVAADVEIPIACVATEQFNEPEEHDLIEPENHDRAIWESRLKEIETGTSTFSSLLEKIRNDGEYIDVVAPLLAEIKSVYRQFLFREPTPQEIVKSIIHFYGACDSEVSRATLLQQGLRGEIRATLGIRPLKLEMDIVNQCNLRCIMCHFSSDEYSTRPKREIALEDFARVADQLFPLCSNVSLSISTEPLLHRKLDDLLRIAAQYKIPFLYMHTNGILLHERVIKRVVGHVHQLSISVDGATKETYEHIRKGANFDRLIANIKALNQAKEEMQSQTPHLCFNVVLMRSNISELPALVHMAHDLGIEGIGTVHMVPLAIAAVDPKEESLQWDKELCNRLLDEAQAVADSYKMHITLPDRFDLAAEPVGDPLGEPEIQHPLSEPGTQHRDLRFLPPRPKTGAEPSCFFPWHFVGLDSDGNLMPCGWWYNQPPMGNILTEDFEAIWNNERYRELRSEHLHGGLRRVCQTCPAAGMGNINQTSASQVR
jgi:radical SAM protein with 4Fe4S-binding SPASM domain